VKNRRADELHHRPPHAAGGGGAWRRAAQPGSRDSPRPRKQPCSLGEGGLRRFARRCDSRPMDTTLICDALHVGDTDRAQLRPSRAERAARTYSFCPPFVVDGSRDAHTRRELCAP